MDGRFWYLKNCPLFEQLDQHEIARVESRCRSRTFDARTPIYLPQDAGDSVLLLIAGRIKLYHITEDGKETILAFIEPGELFGELSLLHDGGRDEYAEAMKKSDVVLIPGDEVRQLMETHAKVAMTITRLFGLRRQRIERRLKSLLFRSNRERLISLLLELVERYGRTIQDGIEVGIRLSHQEMASIIGATRETVTLLLGQLRDEKLLRVQRRRVILRDLMSLAAEVGERIPAIPASESGLSPPLAASGSERR